MFYIFRVALFPPSKLKIDARQFAKVFPMEPMPIRSWCATLKWSEWSQPQGCLRAQRRCQMPYIIHFSRKNTLRLQIQLHFIRHMVISH